MLASPPPCSAPPRDDLAYVVLPLCAFHYAGVGHDVELYCLTPDRRAVQLLCTRERQLAPGELMHLAAAGHTRLLVRQRDFPLIAAALYANLDQLAADEANPVGERLVLVQVAAADALEAAWQLLRAEKLIELAQRCGRLIGDLTARCTAGPGALLPALQHGPGYGVHVTNTAIYVCQLAQALGERSPERLCELAVGALLHDMGLRPADRRGQPIHWTAADDRPADNNHPQQAYVALDRSPAISAAQTLMAYQHHEWADGSGHPVGLVGDEIHPWARMLAVVDRFDALTCDRPLRARASVPEALAALLGEAGSRLDAEYTRCWITAFPRT